MSPSALKQFNECPEEWIEVGKELARLNVLLAESKTRTEREEIRRDIEKLEGGTDAQAFGNLADTLALTPEHFKDIYAVRPDTYETLVLECPSCKSVTDAKKCRKCNVERDHVMLECAWNGKSEECKVWVDEQEQAGKTVITKAELNAAQRAAQRLLSKPAIKKCIECSDKQVHVVGEWHDASGIVVPVQCLLDLVPRLDTDYVPGVEMMWPKTLVDMKTSATANIRDFSRRVAKYGWHVQASFDLALYCAATGEDRTDWLLVCQKNYGVFQPFKRIITQDFLALGKSAYERMLGNYCSCLKSNTWPDHDAVDEAICGFAQCVPEPWMASDEQFAPRMEIEEDEEPTEAIPFTSEEPT